MTKEENIATLNEHLTHWKRLLSEKICDQDEGEKTIDALQNAIKALEKEPCDDCIRRSDIGLTNFEIVMCNGDYKEGLKMLLDKIEKAPSVSPMPKMGKLEWHQYDANVGNFHCSLCNKIVKTYFDYCPWCGAKMEVQDADSN